MKRKLKLVDEDLDKTEERLAELTKKNERTETELEESNRYALVVVVVGSLWAHTPPHSWCHIA